MRPGTEGAHDRTPTTESLFTARSAGGRRERFVSALLAASAAATVLVTVGLVLTLIFEAGHFLVEVGLLSFLLDSEWTPGFRPARYGILPLLVGTLKVAAIASVVALPIGLLTAIYLSEYADRRARALLKPLLETLAGIPTVVYGYFALIVVTPALRSVLPGIEVFNALSAGIVVGIMIIPMVSSLSEDAFRAVPRSLRDGAFALGATRFEVAWRIVLPAAASGVVAAFILALSRAIGETMIVAIAAGDLAGLSLDPRIATQTMTAYIVQMSLGDTPRGTIEYQSLFAVCMTLFLLTLALNATSQRIVRRFRTVYR